MLLAQKVLAHWLLLDDQVLVEVGSADFPAVEKRVVGDDAVKFLLEVLGKVVVGGPRVAELQHGVSHAVTASQSWECVHTHFGGATGAFGGQ